MQNTTNLWGDNAPADPNAKPQLRVALVGCGGISGVHIDGWKRLNPTAKIVACADPIEDRRNQRGDELAHAGTPARRGDFFVTPAVRIVGLAAQPQEANTLPGGADFAGGLQLGRRPRRR